MTKILLARHTHSLVNDDFTLAQRIPDRDIGLSITGLDQAVKMGKKIFEFAQTLVPEITQVHFIISPYKRAVQTADIILSQNYCNFIVSYEIAPLIHEKGLGKFEGYDFTDIIELFGYEAENFLFQFNDYDKKYDACPPHRVKDEIYDHNHLGESYRHSNIRAKKFLKTASFIKILDSKILNVIIGHGRFNTFLEKELMNIEEQDYLSIPIYNNGAFKYFLQTEKGSFEDKGVIFLGFENKKERAMEKYFPRGQRPS